MKTKKTGKTMRVAGLLLALVLVTSCFVGGTFAKYTTGNYGEDNARVAKFGVAVQGTSDMFDPHIRQMIPLSPRSPILWWRLTERTIWWRPVRRRITA